MIKGKMYNSEFYFVDGMASSSDGFVADTIELIYKNIMVDFMPQDGVPELHLIEALKRAGVKDIEYVPNRDDNDVILDYPKSRITMAKDEFVEFDHPRDDGGKFTIKGGKVVVGRADWENYQERNDSEEYPIPQENTLTVVDGEKTMTDGEFYGKNLRSAIRSFLSKCPKEIKKQWDGILDLDDNDLESIVNPNTKADDGEQFFKAEFLRENDDGKPLYYIWCRTFEGNNLKKQKITNDSIVQKIKAFFNK